jgi:peptide/nickel transport system permease protein
MTDARPSEIHSGCNKEPPRRAASGGMSGTSSRPTRARCSAASCSVHRAGGADRPASLDERSAADPIRDFIEGHPPDLHAIWDGDAKVNWAHPLGTDKLGRDILARLMAGGQVSMAVGWRRCCCRWCSARLIGVLAGYFKRLDGPLMRLTDLFLALPLLPLLLVIGAAVPRAAARGLRAGGRDLHPDRDADRHHLVDADRADRARRRAGAEGTRIRAGRALHRHPPRAHDPRHILPNVLSPIMVSATLGIATAIITESALSFLGFGFPPDFPTWGGCLFDAVDRMQCYPERVIWPGCDLADRAVA